MTDPLPETTHFGFTRIGELESVIAKNGGAALNADRVRLDDLLQAAMTHSHDGSPALGDPTDPPTLLGLPSGGGLPAASSYFYRVAYIDEHGMETAASPEETVTTPDPIDVPSAPSSNVLSSGGALEPGIYAYVITQVDSLGGETTPSPLNNVRVGAGSTNIIQLDLPDLLPGADSTKVYRSRPGQTLFYFVDSTTADTWSDIGDAEDQSITAPLENTTNSTNSVQVTIPLDFIPLGCVSWKIYRASTSGGYDGNSLVHHVVEGLTETATTPVTVWTDIGDLLEQGFPQNNSATLASPPVISLDQIQGNLSLDVIPRGARCLHAFAPGVVTDDTVITVTDIVTAVHPTRFTAYFKTPPDGSTVVTLSAVGGAEQLDLVCSAATHQSGDPVGYFHVDLPLTAGGEFQAEGGERSGLDVAIIDDAAAVSGQSVALDIHLDWVQVSLGVLDAGDYTSGAHIRVLDYDEAVTDDLVISAIRTDTHAVLGTVTYTPGTGGHPESAAITSWDGPDFTAPGGHEVVVRVAKDTTSGQSYNVDSIHAEVDSAVLPAGQIAIESVISAVTLAADVNIDLWF